MTDRYQCFTCGKWFEPSKVYGAWVACAVLHGPGQCCHLYDEEVEQPT